MTDRIIRKDGDRTAVTISFPGPGRVKQSFLDECDVNFIMNKWKRTGELPPSHTMPPTYGDFSNVDDYMQAKNSLIEADQAFAALPSWVRSRFQNSPHELISFLEDPSNQEEAEKLGLVESTRPDPYPPADPHVSVPAPEPSTPLDAPSPPGD